VTFPRSSGILLHPTSLPGRFGIGGFGPEAYAFADQLAAAGQSIWQMLPLGPTGYGDSPYQLFSAFAGNPLLISLEKLGVEADVPPFPVDRVDFPNVIPWKMRMLEKAYREFMGRASGGRLEDYLDFCDTNASWLDDYTQFMALKEANGSEHMWTEWKPGVAANQDRINFHAYTQYEFSNQFFELKRYCRDRGIRLMGDLPIYVAKDSADVWKNPELFEPDLVAGVPPDYFSATGQLWGNPIYRWAEMEKTGYAWWVERLRASFQMFDLIRLDHFRGFEAFWQVPARATTAINGEWVKGPGAAFFEKIQEKLGRLPIVAENLGVITPEVDAIREQFDFPGMAILQFAFGTDAQAPDFRPHNYPRDRVTYTGTHDNDTIMGWWQSGGTGDSTRTEDNVQIEKQRARDYLNTDGTEINWVMIRALLNSVANTTIFPLQDLLGLGSEARMNTPGKASGNWRWRFRKEALTPETISRMQHLTQIYDRLPVA
jgi:4-alpha-glucanotransferase